MNNNLRIKPFKKGLALLVIIFLNIQHSRAQMFQQQFATTLASFSNSNSSNATYINASPTNAQLTYLGSSGAGSVISIASNKLTIARSANGWGFARGSSFSGPPTSLFVRFDYSNTASTGAVTSAVVFAVGGGTTNGSASTSLTNSDSHTRIAFNTTANANEFVVRDIAGSTNGATTFSGVQTILLAINNSGSTITYKAPDGTFESVANDKFDLWVGSSRQLDDKSATTASQTLAFFKSFSTSGGYTINFANMLMDPIPSIPTSSAATSITSTSFTANWSTVSGVTGYRVDVATDAAFTSMVSGYNNLYVSGQATNSLVVNSGLSSNTTYYYRVRAASQYTVDEFASGNSSTQNLTTLALVPALTTSVSTLTFSAQDVLTTSSSQSFNVDGSLLSPASGNITMSAPNADWTVSSDNSSFGATATIAYTGATITTFPVYVKFNPQTAGSKTGVNITFSGGSVSSPPTVALTGTATVPSPTIASATNIACTSFDANWSSVTGASSYRLDVLQNSAGEDFNDANFSANPTWSGSTSSYAIETASTLTGGTASADGLYLGSAVNIGNSGLTIASTETNEWNFSLGSTNFAGSSTNYYGIILMSTAAVTDITASTGTSFNGYFLRIGINATPDYLELWKSTGTTRTKIGDFPSSPDFSANSLGSGLNIRITRSVGGQFQLFYATGFTYSAEPTNSAGTLTDATYSSSSFFGVYTSFGSPSTTRRVYFDNLILGPLTTYVTGYQDLNVGNVTTYPVNTNLTANTTYYYRVRAENNSVFSTNSSNASVLVTSSGVWIGSNSGTNNWFDAVNWCGTLPTATTDVSITSGTPFSPAITGSGAVAKSISIGSSATLDINGGDLTMASTGDITNNGTLTVGSSGTLDLVSNQVLGSGSVVLNGTIKTSKAAGFSGSAGTAISNTIGSITLGTTSTVDYTSAGGQSITSGNYANISNSGNGSRTLENGGTIAISGAFSPGSGNYTTTNSTVVYNGTSAQTAVALAPSSKYNNLTINNAAGVSMNANLNLEGALTLTNGVFTTTGYTFTFLSTQTQTARIAPVTGGSISGDVTIQRFVPGGDAGWTFIGMPATGRTIADWTDDITTSGFTGSTTGTGTFVSIYGYDETVGGNADAAASYVGVTDASNAVDPKKGYFVYVADNATTVADKTLDITGPVLTGTQTFNVSYTANTSVDEDGWNLISNPYVSAIDWLSLNWTKTNIDDAIYIYDTETPQYVGSVGGVSYNGGNKIIASSQAFFVHANAASPVLSVSENAKSTLNPTYYRSSSTTPNVLRLQLNDANNAYVDETVFQSKAGASSNFDGSFDAYKLYSFDPTVANISTRMGGIEYVVNSVDVLNSNLDLDVKVNVPVAGTFTINFVGLANYRNGVSCFTFEDKLTQTVIDLSTDSSYTFTSTIDTASAYARFVLHFGVETIVPSITPSATTLSYPGNTTVSYANNSTGASTYSWNFGDGTALETSANPSHTYTAPGVYTVSFTAINAAGCSETISQVITVENVTSVAGINQNENVVIAQSPEGVIVNYSFKNSTKLAVTLYNSLGEKVTESEQKSLQNKGQFTLQKGQLAKGIYTVESIYNNTKKVQKISF